MEYAGTKCLIEKSYFKSKIISNTNCGWPGEIFGRTKWCIAIDIHWRLNLKSQILFILWHYQIEVYHNTCNRWRYL